MPPWSPEEAWSAWDIYQEALHRADRAEARAAEAEAQIAKEKHYCSAQWNFSVFYQRKSMELEEQVKRLNLQLQREKSLFYKMQDRFERHSRIAEHLAGREITHVERLDRKGQLWRFSARCQSRVEIFIARAYAEMRADEGDEKWRDRLHEYRNARLGEMQMEK